MAESVDFYFDFSSPYAYFMAERIDELAAKHGRDVCWRPFLLGAVYRVTGGTPLPSQPLKGDYARIDLMRSARFYDTPFQIPQPFPIGTQLAARAHYWLAERDAALARRVSLALLRAYFRDGEDISQAEVVGDVAQREGVARDELLAAISSEPLKQRLREECEAAIARGVFGSPYVVIDGEPFWGVDRLPQIERWLAEGGF